MIITYHNGSCYKVQFGDTIIAFNPPSKSSSIKGSRFGADIVLVTINHEDMNGASEIGVGDRQPFVVNGPGEYEVGGVFIRGFPSVTNYGGEMAENTVYTVTLEGMNICFAGALDSKEVPQGLKEIAEHIDILFVPIGGDGVLAPSDAAKFSVSLEPSIVIPIEIGDKRTGNTLQQFLKELSLKESEPVDKLTIKKRDLESKDGEVVILKAS